ncbi:MAG: CGGC domain-containing protein [Dehalococcoidales bacterium]|nr:CGGC domain-containing protein [Dehalococcoidales bacterium]
MKIGIIRCEEHSNNCAGFGCFPAIKDKTGEFKDYDEIEIIGFDTCGGCGRGKADKILKKGQRLKERGAEVIHLGNCLTGPCPSVDTYEKALKEELGITVVRGTHGAH